MVSNNYSNSNSFNKRNNNSNNRDQRALTARVLVLGDKQVGKSATIVRYTTGRFIQEYGDSTNDWLYKQSFKSNNNNNNSNKQTFINSIELLEQKDIRFVNSQNFFQSSPPTEISATIKQQNKQQSSLASRVALDQQLDYELHQKQIMLNKLHWANAYIVIYSINDVSTFNKAIKYLNLIANNINSPQLLDNQILSSNNTTHLTTNSNNNNCNNTIAASNKSSLRRLSPASLINNHHHHNQHSSKSPTLGGLSSGLNCTGYNGNTCNGHGNYKRPILLLGNKLDLEKSCRQVSAKDGRLLAMRHLSMFAEVSISNSSSSSKPLESILNNLFEQIDLNHLPADNTNLNQRLTGDNQAPATIFQWKPTSTSIEPLISSFNHQTTTPIWGNLVKSPIITAGATSIAKSRKVISSSNRLGEMEAQHYLQTSPLVSVAKSVETKAGSRMMPMIAGNLMNNNNSKRDSTGQYHHNTTRYEHLKSSFKRASMAIVGGRKLAKGIKSGLMTTRSIRAVETPLETPNRQPMESNLISKVIASSLESCELLNVDDDSMMMMKDEENSIKNNVENNNNNHRISSQPTTTGTTPKQNQNWIKSHLRLSLDKQQQQQQKKLHDTSMSSLDSCGNRKLESTLSSRQSSTTNLSISEGFLPPAAAQSASSSNKFRKPLFKYKNRRTTVALEEIGKVSSAVALMAVPPAISLSNFNHTTDGDSESSGANGNEQQQQAPTVNNNSSNNSSSYSSARSSSGRSSSSLSTTETYYSSLHVLLNQNKVSPSTGSTSVCSGSSSSYSNDNNNNNNNKVGRRKNDSRSTSSRASTSGGSFDEEEEQDGVGMNCQVGSRTHHAIIKNSEQIVDLAKHQAPSSSASSKLAEANRSSSSNGNTSRQRQLVKSVQNTLTNLTKSSNNTRAQAAKRSFCNTLFKYSPTAAAATSSPSKVLSVLPLENITPLIATTEQNLMKPLISYCK